MKLTLVLLFACLAMDFVCCNDPPTIFPNGPPNQHRDPYWPYYQSQSSWSGWSGKISCHWDSKNGMKCDKESKVIDPENLSPGEKFEFEKDRKDLLEKFDELASLADKGYGEMEKLFGQQNFWGNLPQPYWAPYQPGYQL